MRVSEAMNTLVGVCCVFAAAWFGFIKGEYARAAFYGVFGLGCHISVLNIHMRKKSGAE